MDLHYALRGIRKNPAFAAAIVLTLALGIGANAAMFSVVDRLLFRAPPMLRDADLTHRIYLTRDYRGKPIPTSYMPFLRFNDITNWTSSFSRTAQVSAEHLAVGQGTDALEMDIGAVSAPFFAFFDAPPVLGRYFTPAEDVPPTGTPVAVLSYGLWQTKFGGKSDVLGKPIAIGAAEYTIIGVTPRGFRGIWNAPPAAYIPITAYGAEIGKEMPMRGESWWDTYHMTWSYMIAQRKPGVPLARANADLTAAYVKSMAVQNERDHHRNDAGEGRLSAEAASILAERGPNESSDGKVATWIAGVALVVWLIAIANVANLLLARALRRRREIAVRLALGVTRTRLAKQLLTESLLLGAAGGVAGLLLAQWGGIALRTAFLHAGTEVSAFDARTLAFAAGAAVIAGVLTGLAPILQSTRVDLTADLKAGVREGTVQRSRLRIALLVAQGALSVVLLVGAGLFVRSLHNVEGMRLGYDPDRVFSVDLHMRGVTTDSLHDIALRRELLAAARAIPGVQAAAVGVTLPFWSEWSTELHVAGIDSVNKLGEFDMNSVTPEYFNVMGTRLLRGRGITEADGAGAPSVAVVTDAMAKALWPGQDAIGQCLKVGDDTVPCTTVIGIAENVTTRSLTGDDAGFFYWLSHDQHHSEQGDLYLRMASARPRDRETVRKTLQALMPGVSYVTVTPFADIVGDEMKSWRLGATMFTLFGGLALVLAAIGLYSVIAYNVAQRTHELGVRVALGATVRDVMRLVVGEGVRVAVAGVAVGCVIAIGASRWLAPLLFKESARDPVVYVGVIVVLVSVAVVASLVPARRAGKVDPMVALRVD